MISEQRSERKVRLETAEAGRSVLFKMPSLCGGCRGAVLADVIEEGGRIYTCKSCGACGASEKGLVENSARFYLKTIKYFLAFKEPIRTPMERLGESRRQHLLVFLTGRCDSRCNVCLTDDLMGRGPAKDRALLEPTLKDFKTLLDRSGLAGREIIFYGGEPTVREDLPDFIRAAKARGNRTSIYTNGKRLSDPAYARMLKRAGLDWAMVSLDSLCGGVSRAMKGEDAVKRKLAAIRNLAEAGIRVVVTPTIAAGYNDEEIGALLDFAVRNRKLVGQVVFRSMIHSGRVKIRPSGRTTPSDMIRRLEEQTEGRIAERHFVSFMRMRHAVLRTVARLFGERAGRGFIWGTGYSLLLRLDGKGGYESYFSEREMERTSAALERALAERGGAAFVARLAAALPKLASARMLRLAVGTLGAGTDRLALVDRIMGMQDILQLHVTDNVTCIGNLQGDFHIDTHLAMKTGKKARDWEFLATNAT